MEKNGIYGQIAKAVCLIFILFTFGCSTAGTLVAKKVVSGEFTDTGISVISKFNDKILKEVERLEALIEQKKRRLAKIKCLMPLPALQRYALSSQKRRGLVLRDCGVMIAIPSSVIVDPKSVVPKPSILKPDLQNG